MGDRRVIRNQMDGQAEAVVQAGEIRGDVNFLVRDPVETAAERRLRAHKLREYEEEEARRAAVQRKAEKYVRGRHLSRFVGLTLAAAGIICALLAVLEALPLVFAVTGLCAVMGGMARALQDTVVIRKWESGRTITFPMRHG